MVGVAGGAWMPPSFDPAELPTRVDTVEILLTEDARAALEAAPFYGEDVLGSFVDGSGRRYDEVDVNFRGAYALERLIDADPIGRRNWKVKFRSKEPYRNRREWNFNFEPHLRQKLAYDLMRFAGVPVPSARHVVLKVNGEAQGLYLEYEDPDNEDWLWEMFGDASGDLYKAARDLPASEGQPSQKYFADTTYLGPDDASYPGHYEKKTNHKGTVAGDYGALRTFLEALNGLPADALDAWFETSFEVDAFLSYLVVANFTSHWDSFPFRPKNYWLYEIRSRKKLAFIAWDLDATFDPDKSSFNQLGSEASLFFSLKSAEYRPIHSQEGTERPLAFRLFEVPRFEAAYVARYRALSETILSEEYLLGRIDALRSLVEPHLTDARTGNGPDTERSDFEDALSELKEFVTERTASVREQLAALP